MRQVGQSFGGHQHLCELHLGPALLQRADSLRECLPARIGRGKPLAGHFRRRALEVVSVEARRLSRVVDSLLTLARADAGTLAVSPGPNGVKAPPSTRHANTRAVAGVRLSLPPNENVALVPVTGPSGPPVITVSGGVLSTMTVRAAEAVFWPWSVAAAVRVWTPSGLPLVSQLALAVMAGAGGAGSRVAASARLSARKVRLLTFPVASDAWALTDTAPRRWALTGGARNATAGGCVSRRASVGQI